MTDLLPWALCLASWAVTARLLLRRWLADRCYLDAVAIQLFGEKRRRWETNRALRRRLIKWSEVPGSAETATRRNA